MDEEALRAFVQGSKSKRTIEQTEGAIKKFKRFVEEDGGDSDLLSVVPKKLDVLLGRFLLQAKTSSGEDYEPDSLTSLARGVARYFEEQGYSENINSSDLFKLSRQVLQGQRKDLKSKGRGNKPNRAEALSVDEEELLWTSGELGDSSPNSLQNAVWFNNTKFLGFRGNQESWQLHWGDFRAGSDSGVRYIAWNERTTKTRQGSGSHIRSFEPKIWENLENAARCPVRLFDVFASHRPQEALSPDYPFYLSINHCRSAGAHVWYMRGKMGINHLAQMLPRMCQKAGISGRKTNHSIRRTTASRLLNAGVHATSVAMVTGHKNVASLNIYHEPDLRAQRCMSMLLAGQAVPSTSSALPPGISRLALPMSTCTPAAVPTLPAGPMPPRAFPAGPMQPHTLPAGPMTSCAFPAGPSNILALPAGPMTPRAFPAGPRQAHAMTYDHLTGTTVATRAANETISVPDNEGSPSLSQTITMAETRVDTRETNKYGGIFAGATITGGNFVVNVGNNVPNCCKCEDKKPQPPQLRKYVDYADFTIVISSDSD